MSIISDMLSAGIKNMAAHESTPTVEYGPGPTGPWTDLDPSGAGVVIHVSQAPGTYFDGDAAEGVEQQARMTCALSLAALAPKSYVRRNQDDADVWCIVAGPDGVGYRGYDLSRNPIDKYGRDRGRYQ